MRRKVMLAAMTLCGVLLAFLVSLYQTPLYMASATLEIQNVSPEPFEGIKFMNPGDPFLLQTQLQLLKSGALLDRVHGKLSSNGSPGNRSRYRRARLNSKVAAFAFLARSLYLAGRT